MEAYGVDCRKAMGSVFRQGAERGIRSQYWQMLLQEDEGIRTYKAKV